MLLDTRPLIASTFATLLLAVACAKDPSATVAAATVAEPTLAAATASAPAPKGETKALTGSIRAIGSKVTASHVNEFKSWNGTVTVANGEPTALQFEVQTASIVADADNRNDYSAKLEQHLKSPDFFDVEKHPKASFRSTAIRAGGDNGATHTIEGLLAIRGVEKQVIFPVTATRPDGGFAGTAEFTINRKDFGIVYPGMADDLIRDGVVLKIDVKAAR